MELKSIYKSRTGSDLIGAVNIISIFEQATSYRTNHQLLPGCSYSHYGLTVKFSATADEQLLDEIVRSLSSIWEKVDKLTYVCKRDPFYYHVRTFIQKLQNENPPGLAIQWKQRYEMELRLIAQLNNISRQIDNVMQEMASLKPVFDEYNQRYNEITQGADPQRKRDIDARLTIDEKIAILNQLIHDEQQLIDKLVSVIEEKTTQVELLQKRNADIEQEIIKVNDQKTQYEGIYEALATEYYENEISLAALRTEMDEMSRNDQRHTDEYREKLDKMYALQARQSDILHNLNFLSTLIYFIESQIKQLKEQKKENERVIEQLLESIAELTNDKSAAEVRKAQYEEDLQDLLEYRSVLDQRLSDIQSSITYLLERRPSFLAYQQKEKELDILNSLKNSLKILLAISIQEQERLLLEIQSAIEKMKRAYTNDMLKKELKQHLKESLPSYIDPDFIDKLPSIGPGLPFPPNKPPKPFPKTKTRSVDEACNSEPSPSIKL